MALTAEEKAERKERLAAKREARRVAKEEEQNQAEASTHNDNAAKTTDTASSSSSFSSNDCQLWKLSPELWQAIWQYVSVRDLGAWALTSKRIFTALLESQEQLAMNAIRQQNYTVNQPATTSPPSPLSFAFAQKESLARDLVQTVLQQGMVDLPRKTRKVTPHLTMGSHALAYLRFLEESLLYTSTLDTGNNIPLPAFGKGRWVSVSPEHSVSRVSGGDRCGGGGSGVATWGVGKRGQLGSGKRHDVEHPQRLMGGMGYGGVRIVQVAAGGGLARVAHTLLLTSTGRVLSMGTGQYGALGHGYMLGGKQLPDVLRPKYIEALNPFRCVAVAAGELHSAAITSDGDLYTWGDSFCGQCGHGNKSPQVLPVQVTLGGMEDESISQISCGARHSLAVTEEGQVFSWGLGHYGVLGRAYTPYDHDPDVALVGLPPDDDDDDGGANEAENNNATQTVHAEGHGPAPARSTNANSTTAMDVARLASSIADGRTVSNDGTLPPQSNQPPADESSNAWDFNDLMHNLDRLTSLSLDDSSDQCIPMLVDSFQNGSIPIVGVSAGHRHSLFVDAQGVLYSCGNAKAGCLGHGDRTNLPFPVCIQALVPSSPIVQMSAGVDMSMAVTTTGDVYAWGKADGGRLGLGIESQSVLLPRRVLLPDESSASNSNTESSAACTKAIDAECGYVHSLIVTVDGHVHQCGAVGINGQADGQDIGTGHPQRLPDYNLWRPLPEPKEDIIAGSRWKKYGKYEVKGRRKMMENTE